MTLKANQRDLIEGLTRAWQGGKVCLHPTDTIPGLSFDSSQGEVASYLWRVKNRDEGKTCISLVSSLQMATEYWQPLPLGWEELLSRFWPGSLTAIWHAKRDSTQVRSDGTIAFRVPQFPEHCSWMAAVLEELKTPFPSTSVNIAGQKPCASWQEAVEFVARHPEVYVPRWQETNSSPLKSSTIIKIVESGDFIPIREGLIKIADIRKEWHRVTTSRT